MAIALLDPQIMSQPAVSITPAPLPTFPDRVKRPMSFLLSSTESGIRHPSQRLSTIPMGMATHTSVTWSAYPELQIAEVWAVGVYSIAPDVLSRLTAVITDDRFHILYLKETPHTAGLLRPEPTDYFRSFSSSSTERPSSSCCFLRWISSMIAWLFALRSAAVALSSRSFSLTPMIAFTISKRSCN